MTDTASLVIRVVSDGVDTAGNRLKSLTRDSKAAETATGSLMGAWKSLAGVMAGFVGINQLVGGLKSFVATAREFETLNAKLKTVTGSTENAKEAFAALFDFALKAPFTMKEVTQAFVSLAAYGLEPSQKALRAFADIASMTTGSMEDVVRAIARAVAGEYEPLRTLNVQARKDGDEILLTYRGVTERMKNSAEAIQGYFEKLADTHFKGASLERMQTLEGKLSNLDDAWDQLYLSVSNAGIGDLMKEGVDLAISALNELTAEVASGQFMGYVNAWIHRWDAWAEAAKRAFDTANAAQQSFLSSMGVSKETAANFLWDSIKSFPENVKMLMEGIGAYLAWGYESVVNTVGDIWGTLKALATRGFEELKGGFVAWKGTMLGSQEEIARGAKMIADAQATFNAKNEENKTAFLRREFEIDKALEDTIAYYMDLRDKSQNAFANQIKEADGLRKAYDSVKEARTKMLEGMDVLKRFKAAGSGTAATAGFNELVMAIQTEVERMRMLYEKRKDLIVANTKSTQELLDQEEKAYRQNYDGLTNQMELNLMAQKIYHDQRSDTLEEIFKDDKAARDKALASLEVDNQREIAAIKKQGDDVLADLAENHVQEQARIERDSKDNSDLRLKLLNDADLKYREAKRKYLDEIVVPIKRTGFTQIDDITLEMAKLDVDHKNKQQKLQEFYESERVALKGHHDLLEIAKKEHEDRMQSLDEQTAAKRRVLAQAKYDAELAMASGFFGNLSTIASVFGKKGFKAAKALAIVQTTIDTYRAASGALASMAGTGPYGMILGAVQAAAAIALGMKNVAAIRAQEYSGAYAQGGLIPAGKYGLVGETGQPELVRGPAMVTSASRTAELMGGQKSSGPLQVNIANYGGVDVSAKERETPSGRVLDILIKKIENTMAQSVATGGTPLARAMETAYGMNRANQR